jgi:hypothetical protein
VKCSGFDYGSHAPARSRLIVSAIATMATLFAAITATSAAKV